jgi:hypothetical protein
MSFDMNLSFLVFAPETELDRIGRKKTDVQIAVRQRAATTV